MAGIYIHIPFCKNKCTYCDFHFSTSFKSYRKEMITALNDELRSRALSIQQEEIETIYFGGGTPSLLSKTELESIFYTIYSNYTISKNAEITLECNPDDVTKGELKVWKNAGINRLSIGIQSFDQEVLTWMNRAHTVDQSENSIALAMKEGFENISIDLMYGLPSLSLADWELQIKKAISLGVKHISAYCLTIEPKTKLKAWIASGKIQEPAHEDQTPQFSLLQQLLIENEFEHYEISNFAKQGYISKHNSNYWKGVKYIGIGPSAHSYDENYRSWNIANNKEYIKGIIEKKPKYECELLSIKNKYNELILIGLRTKWGIELEKLKKLIPTETNLKNKIQGFIREEIGFIDNKHFILTEKGKNWADRIAQDLFV